MTTRIPFILSMAAALGLTAGCGTVPGWLTQGKFAHKYAKEFCDRAFDCDETGAGQVWGDEKSCSAQYDESMRDAYGSACKYRHSEARECLDSFRELPCDPTDTQIEAHLTQCYEVWECDESPVDTAGS